MEPYSSLLWSQDPANGSLSSVESNLIHHTVFFFHFNITLPSGLFTSGYPTKSCMHLWSLMHTRCLTNLIKH